MWGVVRARVESHAEPARRCVLLRCRPDQRYSGQLARKLETAEAYAGTPKKSRRKNDPARDRSVAKKVRREKTEKKDVDWTNDFRAFFCATETASRTRRERRHTRPLTWHTKRRQARAAAFRKTEERRCRCRDSLLFAKSKKSALSSTSARAICARRHTARHARPAETHESNRPRAHVRPASRQRLAQAGPRPAGELRETRSSDEPTRACGYFFEP